MFPIKIAVVAIRFWTNPSSLTINKKTVRAHHARPSAIVRRQHRWTIRT